MSDVQLKNVSDVKKLAQRLGDSPLIAKLGKEEADSLAYSFEHL